jgi:hypothetical protein
MSPSFLITKNNYSNCPLKKRPVPLYKEPQEEEGKDVPDDNSEPENLGLTASQHNYPHKAITPPPGVALITAKRTPLSERSDAVTSGTTTLNYGIITSSHHSHYLGKRSGRPLEPLNLNTPAESHHHHHHYAFSPTCCLFLKLFKVVNHIGRFISIAFRAFQRVTRYFSCV